jgi:imidazolonepropionase-like amidohydrolase
MAQQAHRVVFAGGRVFDPAAADGAAAFGAADLAVAGGRIVDVGSGLDGDERVDVSGHTLLPGLFDCHVHATMSHLDAGRHLYEPASLRYFEAAANLRATQRLGITTVRDASGADAGVRAALERGLVPGPRLRIAVAMVSQTGGHADPWLPCGARDTTLSGGPGAPATLVDGVVGARRVVRELVRAGADQIKIATTGGGLSAHTDPRLPQLRPDELAELVAEADAAGRYVMAHAHAAAGVAAAVRAGVRSVEHGTMLDAETVGLMAERGTWLVPTLVAPHGVLEAAEAGVSLPAGAAEKCREMIETHRASFRMAVEAGVRVAMGTDCPVMPHGRNLEELGLMVEAGLPAARAWAAATLSAARLMRLDGELGSFQPGKRADVVVLAGDPRQLTGLADRVRQVWQDGVRVA